MVDLLSVVLIWFVSIVVSIASIIQTKGNDWYSPITNKQKMIMTIINVFILFLVIVFMQEAIFVDIKRTLIVSLITILIIFFFASATISKKTTAFVSKLRLKREEKKKNNDNDDDKIKDNNEYFTIKEYMQKLITVFNCTFFLLNIISVFVIMKTQNISSYISVIKADSQIVAYVTVFWLALAGTVVTSTEWHYGDIAGFARGKKVKKDANYYIKKIVSRNH